jgi:hypothetical protein
MHPCIFTQALFLHLLGYRCTAPVVLVHNVQLSALSTHQRKYSDSHRITVEVRDTQVDILRLQICHLRSLDSNSALARPFHHRT